jgi:hypothetical protein
MSGLETGFTNGARTHGTYDRSNENHSRNKQTSIRKENTFTDANGVVKNMSMLNSYDAKNSQGELKVELTNSSVNPNNSKKISIDIKTKQSQQIIQN